MFGRIFAEETQYLGGLAPRAVVRRMAPYQAGVDSARAESSWVADASQMRRGCGFSVAYCAPKQVGVDEGSGAEVESCRQTVGGPGEEARCQNRLSMQPCDHGRCGRHCVEGSGRGVERRDRGLDGDGVESDGRGGWQVSGDGDVLGRAG